MLFVLVAATSAACAPPGSAHPPPLPRAEPSDAAPVEGDVYGLYHHVGGESDVVARDEAIADATQEMGSWIRDMARTRLTRLNPIPEKLAIAETTEGVKIDGGRGLIPAAPLGGPPVEFMAPNGEDTLHVSYAMRGNKLVQTVQGPRGGTRRVHSRKPGGKLVVRVIVFSERLPEPVVYRLHYARRQAPEMATLR